MKQKIVGVLVVLLYTIFVCGAQTQKGNVISDSHITGHVTDSDTKEHIGYAVISIKGTDFQVSADHSGHFLLKNVPAGVHCLQVSVIGYLPSEQYVIVEADKTIEVKFSLSPRILDIDGVVVTASRGSSNRRTSASIVNVANSKLFEKTASNNVAEVLNYQPGLRVEYNCSNCGVPQLRINGLEGQYSQILLDSRPIFSSLAAVYGLEQMPASMIDRVEVIRGGGSALFGSNAIGGVVNIITKEPVSNTLNVSNNTGFMEGGGADINTSLNGAFVSDDNKAGVYLFGMVKSRDSYDRNDDGFSELPELNSQTIGFRGYYKLSPSSRLTAEYHHISEFRRGGNKFDLPPHQADIAEQLTHNIDGGGVRYDFLSKDYKHNMSIYTSMQGIVRDSYFGTHQNPDAYGATKDMTVIAGGQYSYSADRFLFMPSKVTAGIEYTDNKLKDQMLGYNRDIDQRSLTYGIFAQNEWRDDKLSLLIGLRADKHNKIDNVIISPRVNVRYNPIADLGLRVSYSSGYRAPQVYDEDLHVAAVGGEVSIISLASDLRPEYSHSVSGSVDWYHRFGSVEFNILVEGFYTNLLDVFKLRETGHDQAGNLLLERYNASGAIVRGVNAELKVGFTPKLILDAGFTYQRGTYKEAESWSDDPAIAPSTQMLRSPDTYGYLSLNYQPIKGLSLTGNTTYTGPMVVAHYAGYVPNDQEVVTPVFWDLGFRAAYDIRLSKQASLQVSLGVKNALDSFQQDIDMGVMRDAGYIYGTMMPRTYLVGLKFVI